MDLVRSRFQAGVSDRFLLTLVVSGFFMVFLTIDQIHWWRLKPDYAFGWLVPVFVLYLVYDRWAVFQSLFRSDEPTPLSRTQQGLAFSAAFLALMLGLSVFLLGALYRAGVGASQPGSLVLAIGFAGAFLGMVYFNVPAVRVGAGSAGSGGRSLGADARLHAVGLMLFPAAIWILSAPMVTAVENAIALFLLRQVVSVVFTVFSLLGYTLVQEGNVLVLPLGRVGVADACSGIRSLTGCLFAGSFLAAVFLERFWKKILLVVCAMVFAFLTNLLRSLFLTAWAYAYGSDAIEGTLHDVTGFAVLGLTVVGLLALLPFFRAGNWRRWLSLDASLETSPQEMRDPAEKTFEAKK